MTVERSYCRLVRGAGWVSLCDRQTGTTRHVEHGAGASRRCRRFARAHHVRIVR